ncbi:MAG: hypothetical protein AAGL17_06645, partial [Cyanobacteria bacterium J06576_12]
MPPLESWFMPLSLLNPTTKLNPLLLAGSMAALTYAGICYTLYSYQTKLIYRPLPDLIKTPADTGLAYEDIWIPIPHSQSK